MSPSIRACIYALVAIAAANILCKLAFSEKKQLINRATLGWTLLTLMLFLSPSIEVYFIGVGIVVLLIAPRSIDDRLLFYFALLPMIPVYVQWRLSLPGIEKLIVLDHMNFLAILLLLPIYFKRPRSNKISSSNMDVNYRSRKLFVLFFTFLIIAMVLDQRDGNITSYFRGFLSNFLDPILLVLVVFVICQNREKVDKILFGILISGVLLGCLSCVEGITRWQLYHTIDASFSTAGISLKRQGADFRGGLLRTPVSMAPIPFGVFMSVCIVINLYFSRLKKLGNGQYGGSIMLTLVLLTGLIFSGSRGAWIMTCLMLGLMVIMKKEFKALRPLAYFGVIFSLFTIPPIVQYLAKNDPYGTFQYRIDLFFNSLRAISDSFYLGSKDFRDHPAMLESIQGQGIVDVVNSYIGFGLGYGVPMLVLIVFVILSVIRKLSKLRRQMEDRGDMKLLEWQVRTILTLIIGGFVMVISVSLVDRIPHYLWVSLVLGMVSYRYAGQALSAKIRQVDTEDGAQSTIDKGNKRI